MHGSLHIRSSNKKRVFFKWYKHMFLINLFFLKWSKDKGQSGAEHSGTEFTEVSEGQSGGLLSQGCDFPSMLHALGWATDHCFKWYAVLASIQDDFFYVPLTVQVLLVQSGILFHCEFHEYRGNSRQVPGTRKSKASQWWKMGLRSCLRYVNCGSESQTCHLSYLPLVKKSSVCHCQYSAWSSL